MTNSSSTSYIIVMDKSFSKREFIKRMGAEEKSRAALFIGQMYDVLMDGTNDYKTEYEKYYKQEYDTFEEFLDKNKNFSNETIKKIKKAYDKDKIVLIGKNDSAGETPMESYLCLEDFIIDIDGIYIDGIEDGW